MSLKKASVIVIVTLCFFTLLTCGIDDLLYLPQVPESDIERVMTNRANIRTQPLTGISYATGYAIYYKIYIINSEYSGNISDLKNNSLFQRINSDYSALDPYTDPSNASSIPSLTTFSSRGFYELELEKSSIRSTVLSTSGGSFFIEFPTGLGEKPFINSADNPIFRSNGGGSFDPKPDRYFLSSDDLNNFANATSTVNADVSGQSGVSEFAYASMYIVAIGTNQNKGNFSRLYGKPTFINIFKLPSVN